ncbi:hypothetical protein EJ07DRAFT_158337 [Lizonia empirigonia]|nr:hypothetical protein EJ07DRAFT_158337 [Lizonia empirigonia]
MSPSTSSTAATRETPSPQPPTVSVFSPQLPTRMETTFETPPPTYTCDKTSSKNLHIHDDSLRTSCNNSLETYLSHDMLHVRVKHAEDAEKEQSYYVHRQLLCSRSKYFKSRASDPDIVTFDLDLEMKLRTFALYLTLLYSRKLTTKGPEEFRWLCRLFILAERLQDVESKNLVIDGMFSYLQESTPVFSSTPVARNRGIFDTAPVNWLYKMVPESSARRLVVDYYAQSGRVEWMQAQKDNYPTDFFFDIAIRMMQKRPSSLFAPRDGRVSSSDYHEVVFAEDKPTATGQEAGAK